MRSLSYALLLGGLLSLPGCGKVEPFTDAAPVEIDAEVPDAVVLTEVTIRTRTRGSDADAVAPSIAIVVNEPDGSLGPTGQTDAAGELTLEITPGSSVTAVYARATGADLVTFLDVVPGDVVLFGRQLPTPDSTALTPTMRIGWAQVIGATQYSVSTPCGQFNSTAPGDTSVVITRRADCDDSPFDVFMTARDASNAILRWGVQRDVAFAESSTATLPAWQAMTSLTVGITGLPSVVTSASINATGTFDDGRSLTSASFSGAPSGGAISSPQPWTTGGDGIRVSASLTRSPSFGEMQIREVQAGDATSVMLASPVTMPWPANLIGSAAAGDSGSLSWILDGAGTYDMELLFTRWSRPNGNLTNSYEWTVFMPPGLSTLELPTLPPALAVHAPQDTDTFNQLNGGIIDFGADADYRATVLRGEIGVFLSFYSGESIKLVGFPSQVTLAPTPGLAPNPFATVAR